MLNTVLTEWLFPILKWYYFLNKLLIDVIKEKEISDGKGLPSANYTVRLNLTRCNTLQQPALLDLKEAREEDREGLRRKHGGINGRIIEVENRRESVRFVSLALVFFFFFFLPRRDSLYGRSSLSAARSVQWNVRRHRTQQVELGCLSKKLPEFIKPRCGAVRLACSFPTRPLETPFLCGNDRRHSDRRFLPLLPRSVDTIVCPSRNTQPLRFRFARAACFSPFLSTRKGEISTGKSLIPPNGGKRISSVGERKKKKKEDRRLWSSN